MCCAATRRASGRAIQPCATNLYGADARKGRLQTTPLLILAACWRCDAACMCALGGSSSRAGFRCAHAHRHPCPMSASHQGLPLPVTSHGAAMPPLQRQKTQRVRLAISRDEQTNQAPHLACSTHPAASSSLLRCHARSLQCFASIAPLQLLLAVSATHHTRLGVLWASSPMPSRAPRPMKERESARYEPHHQPQQQRLRVTHACYQQLPTQEGSAACAATAHTIVRTQHSPAAPAMNGSAGREHRCV